MFGALVLPAVHIRLLWRPETIVTVRCTFSNACRSNSVHGDQPAMMSLLWRPENIFTVRFCIVTNVCRSVSVHGDQACDGVSNSWLQNLKV
jgi:hypothetical protein